MPRVSIAKAHVWLSFRQHHQLPGQTKTVLELWKYWEHLVGCHQGCGRREAPWTSCSLGGLERLGDLGEYATRLESYSRLEQLRVRQRPALRIHSPLASAESVKERPSNRASLKLSRCRRRDSVRAPAVLASAALSSWKSILVSDVRVLCESAGDDHPSVAIAGSSQKKKKGEKRQRMVLIAAIETDYSRESAASTNIASACNCPGHRWSLD